MVPDGCLKKPNADDKCVQCAFCAIYKDLSQAHSYMSLFDCKLDGVTTVHIPRSVIAPGGPKTRMDSGAWVGATAAMRRLMARSTPGMPKQWSPCMCVMKILRFTCRQAPASRAQGHCLPICRIQQVCRAVMPMAAEVSGHCAER